MKFVENITLLDYETDRAQRNVYAINFEGEISWQIEPISILYPVLANKCFYVGFRFDNENQELKAFNWCDYSCIIGIDTSKINMQYILNPSTNVIELTEVNKQNLVPRSNLHTQAYIYNIHL